MFCAICGHQLASQDRRCPGCQADLRRAGAVRLTDPAHDPLRTADIHRVTSRSASFAGSGSTLVAERRSVEATTTSAPGASAGSVGGVLSGTPSTGWSAPWSATEPSTGSATPSPSAPPVASPVPPSASRPGSPAHPRRTDSRRSAQPTSRRRRGRRAAAAPEEPRGVVSLDAGYRDPRQYWLVGLVGVMVLLSLTTVYGLSKQALSLADRATASTSAGHRSTAVAKPSARVSASTQASASARATSTASASQTPVALATVPASAKTCGQGLAAGHNVSCGLARAVAAQAGTQTGSFSVKAISPNTGITYRLGCLTQGIVVCGSGSIKVYLHTTGSTSSAPASSAH